MDGITDLKKTEEHDPSWVPTAINDMTHKGVSNPLCHFLNLVKSSDPKLFKTIERKIEIILMNEIGLWSLDEQKIFVTTLDVRLVKNTNSISPCDAIWMGEHTWGHAEVDTSLWYHIRIGRCPLSWKEFDVRDNGKDELDIWDTLNEDHPVQYTFQFNDNGWWCSHGDKNEFSSAQFLEFCEVRRRCESLFLDQCIKSFEHIRI